MSNVLLLEGAKQDWFNLTSAREFILDRDPTNEEKAKLSIIYSRRKTILGEKVDKEEIDDIDFTGVLTLSSKLGTLFINNFIATPTGKHTDIPVLGDNPTEEEKRAHKFAVAQVQPTFKVQADIKGSAYRKPGVPKDREKALKYLEENNLTNDHIISVEYSLKTITTVQQMVSESLFADYNTMYEAVKNANPDLVDTGKYPEIAQNIINTMQRFFQPDYQPTQTRLDRSGRVRPNNKGQHGKRQRKRRKRR